MSWLDSECTPHDIRHIGDILSLIRSTRKIDLAQLRYWGGPPKPTLSRIHNVGTGVRAQDRKDSFKELLDAWQSPLNPRPLRKKQIEFLDKLYNYSDPKYVGLAELKLKDIDFNIIDPEAGNPQLQDLVGKLKNSEIPAFIIDPLWFIHAINGAAFILFGMSPVSRLNPFLKNWAAWHVIATKFHEDSGVRLAHQNPDMYFERAIAEFVKDPNALPFFFTKQMRAIRCRILKLSNLYRDHYEYDFLDFIDRALSFRLKSKREHTNRLIKFKGEDIWIISRKPEEETIETERGKLKFTLHFWEPLCSKAKDAFEQIKKSTHYQEVYFAYQYDNNNDFHVNNWDEMKM